MANVCPPDIDMGMGMGMDIQNNNNNAMLCYTCFVLVSACLFAVSSIQTSQCELAKHKTTDSCEKIMRPTCKYPFLPLPSFAFLFLCPVLPPHPSKLDSFCFSWRPYRTQMALSTVILHFSITWVHDRTFVPHPYHHHHPSLSVYSHPCNHPSPD